MRNLFCFLLLVAIMSLFGCNDGKPGTNIPPTITTNVPSPNKPTPTGPDLDVLNINKISDLRNDLLGLKVFFDHVDDLTQINTLRMKLAALKEQDLKSDAAKQEWSSAEQAFHALKTKSLECPLLTTNFPVQFYVKNDGNDANAGSQASPFMTLQKAVDAGRASDNNFKIVILSDIKVSTSLSIPKNFTKVFRIEGINENDPKIAITPAAAGKLSLINDASARPARYYLQLYNLRLKDFKRSIFSVGDMSLLVDHCVVENNTSADGAILTSSNTKIFMRNSLSHNNQGRQHNPGVLQIHQLNSIAYLENSIFRSNRTPIFVVSDAELAMGNNVKFIDNFGDIGTGFGKGAGAIYFDSPWDSDLLRMYLKATYENNTPISLLVANTPDVSIPATHKPGE